MLIIPALMAIAFFLAFLLLFLLLPPFLNHKSTPLNTRAFVLAGVFGIAIFSIHLIGINVENVFWGNRFLHVAGAILVFLLFFTVVRMTRTPMKRIQFFVFGFLLTTTLGVANEVAEFGGQALLGIEFATSIYDTWFDLLSNAVGAGLVGIVSSLFLNEEKHEEV